MILLDANILLRMTDRADPTYSVTVKAVFSLRRADVLVITPQSLHEFWAVATRNIKNNGLGMDSSRATRWVSRYRQMCPMVHDTTESLAFWQSLVAQHGIKGFRAHDAKYVATMMTHGISKFMTYNVQHFKDFPIQIIDPHTV